VILNNLIEEYIASVRSKGMRYNSQAVILRYFSRTIGPIDVMKVNPEAVHDFLYRSKTITSAWRQNYSTLKGLYDYTIMRNYVKSSPLPSIRPKGPEYAQPYIYSTQEIKSLLDKSQVLDNKTGPKLGAFSVTTFRTLLLLLYGTGLRSGEALSLTVGDINIPDSLLIVRNTKFFKTRLVPIGPKLTTVLQEYLKIRGEMHGQLGITSPLFLNFRGDPLAQQTADRYFRLVREQAGIHRDDGAYFQPRLHDFRASFAVHRLVAWYRQGADVQKLLPLLSTYLGHVGIAETQVYLRMTPELLQEANRRFEHYALSEVINAR
jgi:site-specific recombinase XerD